MTALPTPTTTNTQDSMLFQSILQGWRRGRNLSVETHGHFAPGVAEATLEHWQLGALFRLHLRALVCHIGLLSRESALSGATPEERYRSYCDAFFTNHSSEFDDCFAPLVSLRPVVLNQHTAALEELGAALSADRNDLERHFGIPRTSMVTHVESGGDTHDGARRVCILTFDNGQQLVYKPRPVSGETGWEKLAAWLGQESPFALPAAHALNRGSHGWVEYVPALPSAQEGKLLNKPDFLHRCGILIAIMHALNAKDMHRENLRITETGPLPVDLETILHVSQPAGSTRTADDAWVELGASVSSNGLLPTAIVNPAAAGEGWTDIGFLATEAGGGSSHRFLAVLNPFRDDMRLSFESEENWEHPYENRSKEDAVAAAAAVANGFEEAYRWLTAHREEFTKAVTEAFAGARLRYLNGHTQDYTNVLRLSCAAEAMADVTARTDRLKQITNLAENPDPLLTEAEISQLWFGHIPMFMMDAEATTVLSAEGHALTNATHSPLDAARNKIAALGDDDLRQQLDLIWASFIALHPDNHLAQSLTTSASLLRKPGGLHQLAHDLADDLVHRVRPDGSPRHAPSWVGPVPSTSIVRPWAAGVLGFDLYSGRTGVGLALAQAAVVLDHPGARRVAEQIFEACATSLATEPEALTDIMGAGCWPGSAGLPLALARAGILLQREDWRRIAQEFVTHLPVPEGLDIIDGLAGDLLARAGAHALEASDGTRLLHAVLTAPIDDETLTHSGYAHGVAGTLHALAASPLPNAEIAPAVTRLLECLEALRTPDSQAWLSSTFPDSGVATAWCHGGAGIALGVAAAHAARPGLIPTTLVDAAVATMAADGFGRNLTLCHGDSGNWAIASWIARHLGHERAADAVADGEKTLTTDVLRAQLDDRRNRNSLNDSLMVGRSGVLLHLTTRLDPTLGSEPLTPPSPPALGDSR